MQSPQYIIEASIDGYFKQIGVPAAPVDVASPPAGRTGSLGYAPREYDRSEGGRPSLTESVKASHPDLMAHLRRLLLGLSVVLE